MQRARMSLEHAAALSAFEYNKSGIQWTFTVARRVPVPLPFRPVSIISEFQIRRFLPESRVMNAPGSTPLEAEYGSVRARAPRFNLKSISRALRAARAARVTLRRTINFT